MLERYIGRYSRELTEAEPFLITTSKAIKHHRDDTPTWARLLWTAYLLCLHVLILLLLASSLRSSHSGLDSCLLASELPFANDYIRYVDTVFQPGGFTDQPTAPNPYLGPPNADRDALWEALYNVGMVTITAEEAHQLRVKTTPLVDSNARSDNSRFLVTLEVFHQLHCLDYIRHASYSQDHHPNESDWSRSRHVDHCVDYLRQVLTCHGDTTPITLEHVPGLPALPLPNPPPYRPNFAIEHTCRDFDLIYNFALQRNTSGYGVA